MPFFPADWPVMRQAIFDWARRWAQPNPDAAANLWAIPVIWDQPNAPSPAPPYVTLGIVAGPVPEGPPDTVYSSPEPDELVVSSRTSTLLTVSVTVFARVDPAQPAVGDATASQVAQRLWASIQHPEILTALGAFGLAVLQPPEPVQRVSLEIGAEWERRLTFDVRIRMTSDFSRGSNWIEDVVTTPVNITQR